MRRAGRIALNVMTVLSLLLCVGTAGLWVRSYWFSTGVRVASSPVRYDVTVFRGDLSMSEDPWLPPPARRLELRDYRIPAQAPPERRGMVFVGIYRGGAPGWRYVDTSLAYWLALFATPLAWRWRVRSRRRPRPGLCPRCGYDLTGNVSGVCPECGSPVSPAAAGAGGRAGTPASEGGAGVENPACA